MKRSIAININLSVHKNDSDSTNLGSPYSRTGSTVIDGNISKYTLQSRSESAFTGKYIAVKPKTWNSIARGRVKLANRNYFKTMPFIDVLDKYKDNFKIEIVRTVNPEEYYDLNNQRALKKYIIECSYQVMYRGAADINPKRPIKCSIKYDTSTFEPIVLKKPIIKGIDFGRKTISNNGETRDICVYGNTGAEFGLAITETFPMESLSISPQGTTAQTYKVYNRINDISLINNANKSDAYIQPLTGTEYADNFRILRGKIGKSGKVIIKQRFPSAIVKRAFVKAAVSNSQFITFAGASSLKVGDRINMKGVTESTRILISHVNPDEAGDGNADLDKIRVDTNMTIPINTNVHFTRDRYYRIEFIKDYTSGYQDNVSNYEYENEYILNQIADKPVVNWRMLSDSNFAITHSDGVATGLLKTQPLDIKASKSLTKFTLTLDLDNGSNKFKAVNKPRLSQSKGTQNDFGTTANNYRESMFSNTNNMRFRVDNFTYTPVNFNTITISFDLKILDYGNDNWKSLTIPLDISRIIKYGT